MTEARQAALAAHREKAAALDGQRLVDGVLQIEEALTRQERVAETLPGVDASMRAGRGKGRTVAVRR